MRMDEVGCDRATDEALAHIPGWFYPQDVDLFRWFLSEQVRTGEGGDLLELGAYMGKSAVLIGDFVQSGETFTVVDLFGFEPHDDRNEHENLGYLDLSQKEFERYYLGVHSTLPRVVRGATRDVLSEVPSRTHRFIHVDASHLYEHVRHDIHAAKQLLGRNGVVVFDDIRAAHTPGVAAAVWEEVTRESLNILVIGDSKLYATWSDPSSWLSRLDTWLPRSGMPWEYQEIAGRPALRVSPREVVSPTGNAGRRAVMRFLPTRVSDQLREIRTASRRYRGRD